MPNSIETVQKKRHCSSQPKGHAHALHTPVSCEKNEQWISVSLKSSQSTKQVSGPLRLYRKKLSRKTKIKRKRQGEKEKRKKKKNTSNALNIKCQKRHWRSIKSHVFTERTLGLIPSTHLESPTTSGTRSTCGTQTYICRPNTHTQIIK